MTTDPSRRSVLAVTAATGALTVLPEFTAAADTPAPTGGSRHRLWWQAPADEHSVIEQGLPVGNGRLGALASNDPRP